MFEMHCYDYLSDCTCCYNIELNERYTVNQFIQDILTQSNRDRGSIEIYRKYEYIDRIPLCTYAYGNILKAFPNKILNKFVVKANAHGAYGIMHYLIWID